MWGYLTGATQTSATPEALASMSEPPINPTAGLDTVGRADAEKLPPARIAEDYVTEGEHMSRWQSLTSNKAARRLRPDLVGSLDYQRACQTGGPSFVDHECNKAERTFTFVRTLVPLVYRMTVKLKCSELPASTLAGLASVEGIVPTKALLLERIKDPGDPAHNDATAKVKSVILYFALPNGNTLVSNMTVVLNTAIPSAVAGLIHSFRHSGLHEAVATCNQTRGYVRRLK